MRWRRAVGIMGSCMPVITDRKRSTEPWRPDQNDAFFRDRGLKIGPVKGILMTLRRRICGLWLLSCLVCSSVAAQPRPMIRRLG